MFINRPPASRLLAAIAMPALILGGLHSGFAQSSAGQETRASHNQSEAEFQKLMPITGTVDTYFGTFELDHGFPTKQAADKIYDLMDRQRASQLYLWSLPLVATTRIRHSLEESVKGYQDNRFATIRRFNERVPHRQRIDDVFPGDINTSKSAVMLDIPPGTIVGMIVDSWEASSNPMFLRLSSGRS